MKRMQYEDMSIVKIAVNPFYPNMFVYLYLVDEVLVDTGPWIQKRNLKRIFQSWPIQQVALTHSHEDHTGMVSWIANHMKVKILCHENMVTEVNKKAHLPWYRELFTGPRPSSTTNAYADVIQTQNHTLYPIDTPGHTENHICLFEPDKGWLFTGDLYITPYPKVFMEEESVAAYINSLEKLNKYDYHTVFCGHEGIIRNGKEMMNRKLTYLRKTRDEVRRLHQLGFSDRAIRRRMFPERVKLETVSFGSFSRMNLIRSCLGLINS